jgi:hypothetical protein
VRTSRIFARVAGEAIASVFSPARLISLIWMSVLPPGEVGRVGGVKQGLELGGLHGCQHASGGDPLIRGAGFVVDTGVSWPFRFSRQPMAFLVAVNMLNRSRTRA